LRLEPIVGSLIIGLWLAGGPTARAVEPSFPNPPTPLWTAAKQHKAGQVAVVRINAAPYAKALSLYRKGDFKAARSALASAPQGVLTDRVKLLEGRVYLQLGDEKAALAALLEALSEAQSPHIARRATDDVAKVLERLGAREAELEWLDAAIKASSGHPQGELLARKAEVLRVLGHFEAARDAALDALALSSHHAWAKKVEALLDVLDSSGLPKKQRQLHLQLSQIDRMIRARAFHRAELTLGRIDAAQQSRDIVRIRWAKLYEQQRDRKEEAAVLAEMHQSGLNKTYGPRVLFRLGQLSMALDQDDEAVRWFDELRTRFPTCNESGEAQFLTGWLDYNHQRFPQATEKLFAFADERQRHPRRLSALWFAGWSAHLDGSDGPARLAWTRLLEEYPKTELRPQAHYWLSRRYSANQQTEAARVELEEAAQITPLSYYGFLARSRLSPSGIAEPIRPPKTLPPPLSPRNAIATLGPDRPLGVDRALALYEVQLAEEAHEELSAVQAFLGAARKTRDRVVIADLLEALNAHHLSFQVASVAARNGADALSGDPYTWRAFRLAYPKAYEAAVRTASGEHDVDETLIWAIMRTESRYRPRVRSPAGARGLMQLMPRTARQIGRQAKGGQAHARQFDHPDANVWLGTWYLRSLLERYQNQLIPTIGAYNAGPGAMDRWLKEFASRPPDEFVERIPYRETRQYVRRVMETLLIYRTLEEKAHPALLAPMLPRVERPTNDF
jgi:soluble lytic murein transglycosylase